jgi:hypothetical protein
LLSRQPDSQEFSAALEVSSMQGLEIVCRALINSNEFAYIP